MTKPENSDTVLTDPVVDAHPESTSERARAMYPGITFDCALPQPWVDDLLKKDVHVLGRCVWLYPKGSIFGLAGPLDEYLAFELEYYGYGFMDPNTKEPHPAGALTRKGS